MIASNDGNRTPTYALSNPWPNGIQAPPGSSLGPLTFLGRSPSYVNPDFIVPNVQQFSIGVQRELPKRISLDVTYAGSRSSESTVAALAVAGRHRISDTGVHPVAGPHLS